MPPLRKKEVLSWCLYDFANSTYSAVIASVVFPVYYVSKVVGNQGGRGDLWWGWAVSLSMLTVAAISPLLGGIADFAGMRKRFLLAFTLLCLLAVAMLHRVREGMVMEGFLLVVLANIGMEGAGVFYNSFLPVIVPKDYIGRVSSWGYGVGYAGSILSLLAVLPLAGAGQFGYAWAVVAVLFAVFSLPAFLFLPPDRRSCSITHGAREGMRYVTRTFSEIWRGREARRFLIAYFLYIDGVNTIIVFSSIFAATTLGFAQTELIWLYLAVQGSALAGAFVFARAVDTRGPKAVVTGSLVLWSAVTVMAFFIAEKLHFWLLAAVAGVGLGTVQASSRALYSRLIPPGKESEYFGVYALAGKSSSVLGPLLFGHISSAFGSQRPAVLAVTALFAAGILLLRFVKTGTAPRTEF